MEFFRAFAANLPGYFYAIEQVIMFVGFICVGGGLWQLYSQRDSPSFEYPRNQLVQMGFGGILLSFVFYLEVASTSLLLENSEVRQMLSYSASTSMDSVKVMVDTLLAFVRAVGWYAFAKGLWEGHCRMRGQQNCSYPKAIVLMAFGSLMANILVFTDYVAVSVGLENFIRRLI